MQRSLRTLPITIALLFGLAWSSEAFAQANIVILNDIDAPGVGFNDTTPAAPVGGNNGTTIGEQRLIAVQAAANIWGASVSSSPTIVIRANWQAITSGCTSSGGTLASAGNNGSIWRDFSGSVPGHFYGNALASALSGIDRNGPAHEINARFNISVGTPGCLDGSHWYYGLDANEGPGGIDLVAVALHEFAHGLGFQTFTSSSTGIQMGDAGGSFPSIYDRYLFDNSTNKGWEQMTNAERHASAINTGNLVWTGPQVIADGGLLVAGKDPQGHPRMFAPNPVQGGSSVSHWDSSAGPNQLMEPNISRFLTHSVSPPQDLTLSLFKDIGWPVGAPPPPPPTPGNDNFANAQTISGCTGSVNGTNFGATRESGEPSHAPDDPSSGSPNNTVWYRWQAPASTSVTIDTVGNTNFDTIVAVYTSFSAAGRVTFNDDIDPGIIRTSRLTFNAVAGTTYWIVVDGWGGENGDFQLNWNQSNCTVVGPTIFVEQGTNAAAAVDSVTQVKGPFTVMTPNNFSQDGRRRIIFFTTDLGLPAGNTTGLTVRANNASLPVETAGPFSLISGSYVIVRLDNLAPGTYNLIVTLNGADSTNAPTIQIIP